MSLAPQDALYCELDTEFNADFDATPVPDFETDFDSAEDAYDDEARLLLRYCSMVNPQDLGRKFETAVTFT